MKKALILFTKIPVPGQVKKRLGRVFKSELAAILYSCFIKDMILKLKRLKGIDIFVSYTPKETGDYFKGIIQKSMIFSQEGQDLSERIFNSFRYVFLRNYEAVCFLAGDSPDLPVKYINNSFKYLNQKRQTIVSGPCLDGGCYLVGINRLDLADFVREIPWKQEDVFKTMLERSEIKKINFCALPCWYDIDKPSDIVRLLKNIIYNNPAGLFYTKKFLLEVKKFHS